MEEVDTYLQQYQVSKDEYIRVAALHLEGKAYAWWFYESYSIKYVNMFTYASFTRNIVKRFDERHFETSVVELS